MMDTATTKTRLRIVKEIEEQDKTALGFWIYLMTDCVIFASLFAVYAVLHKNTAGGPSSSELFHLPYVLIETILLLTSSFTAGLVMMALRFKMKKTVLFALGLTFALGLSFLLMEVYEFSVLIHEGHSWQASSFLSSYFTLVGTHGFHILIGLLWLVVLTAQIIVNGLQGSIQKRLTLFSLFWHFLDIVWIFIFTFVYLSGGLGV